MTTVAASCLLLESPWLEMPTIKLALPGANFLGRAAGAAKNLPTVIGNNATQGRANFNAGVAAQHVPKLSPEQAAINAQPKPAAPAAPKGIMDHLTNMSGRQAAGLGASAMALKGWVDPGQEYDEYGHAHQKSRLTSALGGAITGAGAGLLAAPMIRGGAKLHAGAQPAPAAPAAAPAAPVPTTRPDVSHLQMEHTATPTGGAPGAHEIQSQLKKSDYQTPATSPTAPAFRSGDRPSPAGGAPATGNGVASGKTAEKSDDMSKEKAKEVTDPELNANADKKLPYKVPSLKLKK